MITLCLTLAKRSRSVVSAMTAKTVVVGITGASGAIYGVRLLQVLAELGVGRHLVISSSARRTISEEMGVPLDEVSRLASTVHAPQDVGASIASGSFRHDGMAVAPCSIKTAGAIAYCQTSDLISRAADVCLKERRRLVLLVRETPLHVGHLRMLTLAAEAGSVIMPPVPAFYTRPTTISHIVDHTIGRLLDVLGIDCNLELVRRWGEQR